MKRLPKALAPLADYEQFIIWRLVPDTPKDRKVPFNLGTMEQCDAHNPANWMDAETAITMASLFGDDYSVGYVLTEDDPFWCIDIDGQTTGPLVDELIGMFPGCAVEISHSGNGLHIWGVGTAPDHSMKNIGLGIEFYTSKRFMALTFDVQGDGVLGADYTTALPHFVSKYFPGATPAGRQTMKNWTTGPASEWDGPDDDDVLIKRAMSSGGAKQAFGGKASFADLFNANVEALSRDYPDQSESDRDYDASSADMALAQHLAFWTGKDCARMERIMKRSELKREKWTRHRTYLQRTILRAFAQQENVYRERDEVEAPPQTGTGDANDSPLARLLSTSANGESARMKTQMLNDEYVLQDIAILGQWTVFYAAPNIGKTLIVLRLLCESVEAGRINGHDVFYANCDDTFKGGIEKLEIAEERGVHMLLPGVKQFNANDLPALMDEMAITGEARGKVIILDTLKKFTDLMDKTKSSQFGDTARKFVAAGGSIICLAHVNKKKGDDGKSVYAGTSDIRDDADCCYTIELVNEQETTRTVEFENTKARGDVTKSVTFKYERIEGRGYQALFDSVTRVSDDDSKAARKAAAIESEKEKDRPIINSIRTRLEDKPHGKTDLVKKVKEDCGATKLRIIRALQRWTGSDKQEGHMWHVDKQDKNLQMYQINSDVRHRVG